MKDITYTNSEAYQKGWNDGYVEGAIGQKKKDIENGKKFCKQWFDEMVGLYLPELKDEPFYSQGLKVIYNKYEKAMSE